MKKYTLDEVAVRGCTEFRTMLESVQQKFDKFFNIWGHQEDLAYTFNVKILPTKTDKIEMPYHKLVGSPKHIISVEEFKKDYYDDFLWRITELSNVTTNSYSII
jgi:hypothetical protein